MVRESTLHRRRLAHLPQGIGITKIINCKVGHRFF